MVVEILSESVIRRNIRLLVFKKNFVATSLSRRMIMRCLPCPKSSSGEFFSMQVWRHDSFCLRRFLCPMVVCFVRNHAVREKDWTRKNSMLAENLGQQKSSWHENCLVKENYRKMDFGRGKKVMHTFLEIDVLRE